MADLSEAFSLLGINRNYSLGYNVQLPQIYEKLTLGDFEYSRDNKDQKVMIINLCAEPLKSNTNNLIYNFQMNDSEEVPFNYFKNIISQCVQLIYVAEHSNYPVIVNCAAGINRSCSVIVAYALQKEFGQNNIDHIIEYIKQEKKKKYSGERWSTLTNHIFVNHLRRIKNGH